MPRARWWVICCAWLAVPAPSYGDVVLLLGEPYGRFGSVNPTGHLSLYVPRVCATTPAHLRRCAPGETGVVISRYHRVANHDWLAIPLIPYLYAVERAEHVPQFADAATVSALRDGYRRAHLRDLIPDASTGAIPSGDWIQLAGSAYDRRLVAFVLNTTPEQDDELIALLNARPNTPQFNLFFRNCADFARDLLNLYFPKSVRSSVIADLGLTTPKQIAKSLVNYGRRHPELELSAFVIAQIPGSRESSRNARGVLESLVKTKKYAIPLTVVQPWVPTGMAAGYFITGRFNADQYAMTSYTPLALEREARRLSEDD